MTTKIPGFPPIPQNIDAATKAYLRAIGEALQVRLGQPRRSIRSSCYT